MGADVELVRPPAWHSETFQDAPWWRAMAEKWERLRAAAEDDGDMGHAEVAARAAANCRDIARRKELSDLPPQHPQGDPDHDG